LNEIFLYKKLYNIYIRGKKIMNIKRKILGIFICVLMLATIPLAAGMAVDSEPNDPQTTEIGRTVITGVVFNYRPNGLGHKFFALRVRYTEITPTTRTVGAITLRTVTVGREANIGFNYMGPVGTIGVMMGFTFKGGIDF
jgi:hypothetical protein